MNRQNSRRLLIGLALIIIWFLFDRRISYLYLEQHQQFEKLSRRMVILEKMMMIQSKAAAEAIAKNSQSDNHNHKDSQIRHTKRLEHHAYLTTTNSASTNPHPKNHFPLEIQQALKSLPVTVQESLSEVEKMPLHFGQSARYYRNRDILYCPIQKVCNTYFQAMFCRANVDVDPTVFYESRMKTKIQDKACEPPKAVERIFEYAIPKQLYRNSGHNIALVRDPFTRYVSAFMFACYTYDKFNEKLCLDCPINDFVCILRNLRPRLENIRNNRESAMNMDLFLNHVYPQAWYCHLVDIKERYTVMIFEKTEAFRQQARELMLKWKLPEDMVVRGWGPNGSHPFLGIPTAHTAAEKMVEQYTNMLLKDASLANDIFKLYYLDYINFNFKLPRELLQLCEGLKENDQWAKYELCHVLLTAHWPTYDHDITEI